MTGLLLASLTVLWPQPAQAATDCDATVSDITAGQVLDVSAIEAASANLESRFGAEVRVRGFQANPGMGMDAYHEQMLEQCPSWRGPDGEIKPNLISYLFSIDDRESKVSIGANYTDEISHDELDEIRDVMGNQFREGDFTAGIVDAQTATVTAMEPSKAGTYALWGFGIVLGLGLLIAAGFFLVRLRTQRKQREQDRLKAQRTAIAARDKASESIGALSMEEVTRDFQIVTSNLNDEDKQWLTKAHAETSAQYERAIEADSKRSDRSAGLDPESDLTTAQYQELTNDFDRVTALSEDAKVSIGNLQMECTELLTKIERAPQDLARVTRVYDELKQQMQTLEADGYVVDKHEEMGLIGLLLEEATTEINAKRYGHGVDEISEADNQAASLAIYFEELALVRQGLLARHAELTHSLQQAQAGLDDDSALEQMRSSYDESCWQDVSGRHSETTGRLSTAKTALEQAQQDMSMDSQKWKSAGIALDQAEELIGNPDDYSAIASARLAQLQDLEVSVPIMVRDLKEEAGRVRVEVESLKGSQSHNERKLSALWQELDQLETQLQDDRPRLLEIDQQAGAIDVSIADVLKDAQKKHKKVLKEKKEEEEREARRAREREDSYSSSSLATGYVVGSASGGHDSGGYSGGGGDSSSGSWGGGGDSSSGSW